MSSPPQKPSAIAERPLGGDLELALLHMPERHRAAIEALFQIDSAMGDVVARSTDPALGRIKLAWWREQLERLDSEPSPAEPRLHAVARQLFPRRVSGAELAGLETGWATLLDPEIDPDLIAARGALLFLIAGKILDEADEKLAYAGELYALASVARRGLPELFDPAAAPAALLAGHRFPRPLRSLTGLARLAARDMARGFPVEPEGNAGRATEMLRHRWSGMVIRQR